MQISRLIRKHASPARREAILRRYRNTRLTQRDFAAQAGISVSTLLKWLQKASLGKPLDKFIALPNVLTAPAVGPVYRLVLPSGTALEVRSGFTAQELATWLQLLPRV